MTGKHFLKTVSTGYMVTPPNVFSISLNRCFMDLREPDGRVRVGKKQVEVECVSPYQVFEELLSIFMAETSLLLVVNAFSFTPKHCFC